MPCGPEGKGEVYSLGFASGNEGTGEVRSAQLLGALVGDARDKFKKDQEEAIAAVAVAEAAAAPAAADPTTTTTA